MFENQYQSLLLKVEKMYRTMGALSCPALNGEKIYFNKHGLRHLSYKGRAARSPTDQINRFLAFMSVREIVTTSKTFFEYREMSNNRGKAYFWSLVKTVGGRKVTIVIRQIDNGSKHFFSSIRGKKVT